jgi:hypothetical protein
LLKIYRMVYVTLRNEPSKGSIMEGIQKTVIRDTSLKMVALMVIIGVPTLLCVGLAYDTLTPREWAIGFLVWFATLLLWAALGKLVAKKTLASRAEPLVALDDATRRRILRKIWVRKAWIVILAVLLPIGTANGILNHAWLPTLAGIGMNLLWMYVARENIRRLQKSLNMEIPITGASTPV